VADQSVLVGKGRRAEDCPPYLRRCVNLNVNCYIRDFVLSHNPKGKVSYPRRGAAKE